MNDPGSRLGFADWSGTDPAHRPEERRYLRSRFASIAVRCTSPVANPGYGDALDGSGKKLPRVNVFLTMFADGGAEREQYQRICWIRSAFSFDTRTATYEIIAEHPVDPLSYCCSVPIGEKSRHRHWCSDNWLPLEHKCLCFEVGAVAMSSFPCRVGCVLYSQCVPSLATRQAVRRNKIHSLLQQI